MYSIDNDYFDCPNCGVKNVAIKTERIEEEWAHIMNTNSYEFGGVVPEDYEERVEHRLIRCKREECERITYFKILAEVRFPGRGIPVEKVVFQSPPEHIDLPDFIPAKIREYFLEANLDFSYGLTNSASIMCRKVIYAICDNKKVAGNDYKEKIANLELDKRLKDPLLNIKNIGDETVHAKGWDTITVGKALAALKIIIERIYIQEEEIKEFSKHYSKTNQERLKSED